MKTVIMAGGKGTRISTIAHEIPKPMIPVEGKPVLEHELESLREQGFVDVLITVSHLGDKIMAYFGDGSGISPATGKPFGVHIEYYVEKEPLGNAGALFKIRDKLDGDFLLLNADALFDVDFKRFVNAGLHILKPEVLDRTGIDPLVVGTLGRNGKPVKVDLDRQILKPLAGTGEMFCYNSPEYVKDMGTPERYYAVCEDMRLQSAIMQSVKICGWVESAPGRSVTNKKRCFSTGMARSTAMWDFSAI